MADDNNARASRFSASTERAYEPIRDLIRGRRYGGKVTELSINGPGTAFMRVAGAGYERLPAKAVEFITPQYVRHLCEAMAANIGVEFTSDMPILACRTPDGCRLQVDFGNHVLSGFLISIRVPRVFKADFSSFEVSAEDEELIRQTIADEKGVLLSGSTGSGKTTFQNILLRLVDPNNPNNRVLTVEDTEEMEVDHINQGRFILPRQEGASRVNWRVIIDSVIRHNPTSIFPGELSLLNAFPILQLIDTGHESVITTMHANSPIDALRGFRRRVALAGGAQSETADMLDFLADNVGLVIQIKHVRDANNHERRVVTDVERPKELVMRMRSSEAEGTAADMPSLDSAVKLVERFNGTPLTEVQKEILATEVALGRLRDGPATPPRLDDGSLSPEEEFMVDAMAMGRGDGVRRHLDEVRTDTIAGLGGT